jgi:hypothetical protein
MWGKSTANRQNVYISGHLAAASHEDEGDRYARGGAAAGDGINYSRDWKAIYLKYLGIRRVVRGLLGGAIQNP